MVTFIATIHIIACLALIALVLIQDSKGGGVFSSQGSSSSVLGANGATSLASTMTKIVSAILVITCISLAMISAGGQKSILDSGVTLPPAAPVEAAAAATATSGSATTEVPAATTTK